MKKAKLLFTILIALVTTELSAQDTLRGCFQTDPFAPPFTEIYACPITSFGSYAAVIYNGDTFSVSGDFGGINQSDVIETQGIMDWYCDRAPSGAPDTSYYFIGNPMPQICIITSDSNSHPLLYIDSSTLYGNDPLLLQRKVTTTSWMTVTAFTPGSLPFITDTTANTATQSYTYRLKSGSCIGFEHTTIHLEANGNNLIWNEYMPNYPPLRGYYINKRDINGNFSLIDSTTGFSYTDLNFRNGDEYFVEAFKDDVCPYAQQLRMGDPISVRSNRLKIGAGCAISITTQPVNVTATSGDSATFKISVSPAADTYQWQINSGTGWQNISDVQFSGTDNDTLTVTNLSQSNNNQTFRCIITSGSCSDTSLVATLIVECAVTITTQPNSISVTTGSTATIIVGVSSAVAYQWQTDLGLGWQNLSNAGQYTGANSASLTIANITFANDNLTFRCIVSSLGCSDTSSSSTLSVFTTSIKGSISVNSIVFYPNPIHSNETLEYSLQQDEVLSISLYDMGSRLTQQFISNESRSKGNHKEVLRFNEDLPSGNYLLTITNEKGSVSVKVMKQ